MSFGTYQAVLDEPPSGALVQGHVPLLRPLLRKLDLLEILLYPRELGEDGVLFRLDAIQP